MATLTQIMIDRATNKWQNEAPSSNSLIRVFTEEVFKNKYTEAEIFEAQQHIKSVVKSEVVAELDKQIENFKFFVNR